jgi:hypothetical protein
MIHGDDIIPRIPCDPCHSPAHQAVLYVMCGPRLHCGLSKIKNVVMYGRIGWSGAAQWVASIPSLE